MTDEKLAKLPQWARNEITRLRANERYAQEKLAASMVPAEPNRPSYGDYDDKRGMGLPCRKVRFSDYGIDVYVGQAGVEIHGDGSLSVRPDCTNVIVVLSDRVERD